MLEIAPYTVPFYLITSVLNDMATVFQCFMTVHWELQSDIGGIGGTDAPQFPPLHSIDAIIGLSEVTSFTYTRNELWQFAVDGNFNPDPINMDGHASPDYSDEDS